MGQDDPQRTAVNCRYGKAYLRGISRELNNCRAIRSLFGFATDANGGNFCRNAFQTGFILNTIGNPFGSGMRVLFARIDRHRNAS